MPEPVIQNVSDTAFMVAMHRATESERADALFRDPLASKVAGERGKAIAARLPRSALIGWSVAVRTVIIDDYIQAAVARGADTVLNLGAGLDTRPFRMSLPETLRWIEVDYPPLIDLKEARLASDVPCCRVERVKMDLADLPARRRLLADVDENSKHILVLTEGVVPYLTVEDVGALADDIRRMKAAHGWIVDYFSPRTMRYRRKVTRKYQVNAPFRFEPEDWFRFFEEHGWKPKEKRFLAVEGRRLGRPVPWPPLLRAGARLIRPLLSRARRESMRDFAGYFLLEPV
jgi:methyltransferase (TIGR00027 family)